MRQEWTHSHRQPGRAVTILVAVELLLLGGLFLRVLVANWSDNAYLGLALIGVGLLLASGPFVIAAMLPKSLVRRMVLYLGVGVLGMVAVLSAVILLGSLAIIPSQNYHYDQRVFGRHLWGPLVLLPALAGTFAVLLHGRHEYSG